MRCSCAKMPDLFSVLSRMATAVTSAGDVSASDAAHIMLDENILTGPILVIVVAMFLPILVYYVINREIRSGFFPFISGALTYIVLYIAQLALELLFSFAIPGDSVPTALSIIISLLLAAGMAYGTFRSMRIYRRKLPHTGHGVGVLTGYCFSELTLLVAAPAIVTVIATYNLLGAAQAGQVLSGQEIAVIAQAGSVGISDYIASTVNCLVWIAARAAAGVMLWLAATKKDAMPCLFAGMGVFILMTVPTMLNGYASLGTWWCVVILAVITAAAWYAAVWLHKRYIDNPVIRSTHK